MNVFEWAWRRLVSPIPSRALCALVADGVVMLDRRSQQSIFRPWLENVFQPSFDAENVLLPEAFTAALQTAAQTLGLAGERRWSVLLPASTARTHVITIEAPTPRQDVPQVMVWKAERLTGLAAGDIWMTTSELGRTEFEAGRVGRRFLMVAMHRRVALDLQSHLQRLNWQPGLVLPQLLCESLWLQRAPRQDHQMLISVEGDALAVMLLRKGLPLAVRTLPLAGEAPAEQLLRLLLFFREHAAEIGLSQGAADIHFEVLAINVPLDVEDIRQPVAETFGASPSVIEPRHLGFASPLEFSRLAGVAGLAAATA
ncbi:MAG: hypothetical protein SNJ67_06765 [Chloracidobacterium sp.]